METSDSEFSEAHFLHLYNAANDITYLISLFWELKEICTKELDTIRELVEDGWELDERLGGKRDNKKLGITK